MKHLIYDCKRQRIAIVSDCLSHTSYLLRYLAYRDALLEAGLQVPEDIAVTGYDGTTSSKVVTPALTTIRVDRNEIGRTAVRLLMELIENPSKESETIYIPNELIVRGSTLGRPL